MTGSDRVLGPDDDPTADELFGWHQADRPNCGIPVLSVTPDGFRCPNCGWSLDADEC